VVKARIFHCQGESEGVRRRTASTACRTARFHTNCSTLTVASWAGDHPGRPSRGCQAAKPSSRHNRSRRLRTHIEVVPLGILARATCALNDGIRTPGPLNAVAIAHTIE
jgi:hypothetical protein